MDEKINEQKDETSYDERSDTVLILAVMVVILIIAGVLYLFYRV